MFGEICTRFGGGDFDGSRFVRRPWSADANPLAERNEVFIFELAGGRHLDGALIADSAEEATFGRLRGVEQGPPISTFLKTFCRAEVEACSPGGGVVTALTFRCQHGADLCLEILNAGGLGRR